MAEYLVNIGIDSMSLNPDTVIATTRDVLEIERRLGRCPRTAWTSEEGRHDESGADGRTSRGG